MLATRSAYSSGRPSLGGKGTWAPSDACNSGVMPATIGVMKMPGAMTLTRTPMRANSRASGKVMPTTPPLDAEYETWPICPSNAATDAVLTIKPRSPSAFGSLCCITLAASFATVNEPTRLMATVRAKNSVAIGASRPSARAAPTTPAQFTASVMPPMNSADFAMAAWTSASSATSAWM